MLFPTCMIRLITHRLSLGISTQILAAILLHPNLAEYLLNLSLLLRNIAFFLLSFSLVSWWFTSWYFKTFVLECLWGMRIQLLHFVATWGEISTFDLAERKLLINCLTIAVFVWRLYIWSTLAHWVTFIDIIFRGSFIWSAELISWLCSFVEWHNEKMRFISWTLLSLELEHLRSGICVFRIVIYWEYVIVWFWCFETRLPRRLSANSIRCLFYFLLGRSCCCHWDIWELKEMLRKLHLRFGLVSWLFELLEWILST